MQKALRLKLILFLIIITNLFLNIYGNDWGLPSRWHSDEKVASVLHMADQKTLVDDTFDHPTGYHLSLLISFIPVYGYLKLINFPILSLKEAASVSWDHMAKLFPGFASGIYIYARTLSAILGALTVYLIYLLGKEMYDERTGLLCAASLSVCMGFMGINHLAKYKSLVNLLIVLTILLCVKGVKSNSFKVSDKYLFFAFLFGGLSVSTHINAFLLSLPLFLTFIFISLNVSNFNFFRRAILLLVVCVSLYVAGVILGTPSFLTNFADYFSVFKSTYNLFARANKLIIEKIPIFLGCINYIFEILSIYGIPLFALILAGIIRRLFSGKKIIKEEIIVFSFIFAYYFIIAIALGDKYPKTKHIIAIVPLLAIFSGKSMADIFSDRKISGIIKFLFLALIFLYSFAYSFKADLWFKKGDTRYASTSWILENIPRGSKIEVFNQLHYVASTDIMDDYNIIYLGRSSKNFRGKRFFNWNTVENREEYLRHINQYDSLSDYIIIGMNYDVLDTLAPSEFDTSHLPGRNEYIISLFENKKNFRIVTIIRPKNQQIISKKIKGFVHFENLWWDPIPNYIATAPIIYIFQRIK